jgi:putative protease
LREKPDALICADMGVAALAKDILPDIDIHISTQANTQNYLACLAWAKLGAKRIILSRELSLADIKLIRENLPDNIEIECFIHGSMCVSYSGRCLLSNYYVSRDANRGMCTQPCRWKYYVTEEKRPDIPLEIQEDSSGTYLFSSKDLCMIEHIDDLVLSGINSLKIEGRMKSAYYTASITNAYRIALDTFYSAPDNYIFDGKLKTEVESVSHRQYDTGYFYGRPNLEANICENPEYIREKAYLGVCVGYEEESGAAVFEQRNKAVLNQKAQILSPSQTGIDIVIDNMCDAKNTPIESAPHPFMIFKIRTGTRVKKGDILRGL